MRFNNKQIIIATKNSGKVREFADMFAKVGLSVRSLHDVPNMPEIVEDGETFLANAEKKARTIARAAGIPVLADDSGLRVDLLDGAPGVYSARFAGEHATDRDNNEKLLDELRKKRHGKPAANPQDAPVTLLSPAQYVCALVLYDPAEGNSLRVEGECSGYIIAEPRGHNGFGYDPYFYVPEYGMTMAELAPEVKNAISHRGKALRRMLESLEI
ncbi:MAG TPA: XTP/dITP diphosphatase [Bacilli bacterium]